MASERTVSDLSTVQMVAERLHLHVQTVRGLIKDGELGHIQVGKYKLIAEDQIVAFLAARRTDVA